MNVSVNYEGQGFGYSMPLQDRQFRVKVVLIIFKLFCPEALVVSGSDQAENLHRLRDILENHGSPIEHDDLVSYSACSFGAYENVSIFGGRRDARSQIRHRSGRGKGHPRAGRTLKSTHAQRSLSRVDPHVDLNRLEPFLQLLIYFRGPASDFEGSPSRIDGVLLAGALKYHHQSVAGCFIDIAVMGVKNVQKAGKVFFDNEINFLLGQILADMGVSCDIQEQN